jgi:DNA invertase Pin-like site-specific DNA recombinase
LAAGYVRPSTPQQRIRHQESTRWPSGLVERALALGWATPQGLVMAEDFGTSADSAAGRAGFQRLVAEVSVAHGGILVGLERARVARAHRDGPPLRDVGALFGPLIGDLDGMDDPTDDNARLVVGRTGARRAAALPGLTQRMRAGTRAKAARGALGMPGPMGAGRRPAGEGAQEPDEQAPAVIERLGDQCARGGTSHAV